MSNFSILGLPCEKLDTLDAAYDTINLTFKAVSDCCSYGIAAIAPFSHRLAFDNLPSDIQLLRCRVNFQALVFVPHIRLLGDALINRLRSPSKARVSGDNHLDERSDVLNKQGAGKFVVLHLRFDKV